MSYCPITFEEIGNKEKYSIQGLTTLSPKLNRLNDFPYTAQEQIQESFGRVAKLSIQGVQPKLSAKLSIKKGVFEIVDQYGTFILKPQSPSFKELPENEALTMFLARSVGIHVPISGLVYSADKSMTYFVKRFDRFGKNKKIATEDFAQLSGNSRDTKYDFTMEKVGFLIDKYCTFPAIDKIELFKRVLFCFISGNEDMHLKNYSLISRDYKTTLAPAYDLVNTTIVIKNVVEEIALPLNGKKNHLKREDLIDYFAFERLKIQKKIINEILFIFKNEINSWDVIINKSYLSNTMKSSYLSLVKARQIVVGI